MSRLFARLLLLTLPALALVGCGSNGDAEQLAQAQATASEAAAAEQAAKDAAALRAKDNEQSLEAFYAGDEPADDAEAPDNEPARDSGPSIVQAPSVPDAPPPGHFDAGSPPPPIPPVR